MEPTKDGHGFEGRARRKEYWMFVLCNIIFLFLASIMSSGFKNFYIIFIIYTMAMIIPTISVMVRRMHDIGKSGCWILIRLIPSIGGIWLLILLCTEGQIGINEYGGDPKYMDM